MISGRSRWISSVKLFITVFIRSASGVRPSITWTNPAESEPPCIPVSTCGQSIGIGDLALDDLDEHRRPPSFDPADGGGAAAGGPVGRGRADRDGAVPGALTLVRFARFAQALFSTTTAP